MAAPAAQFPLFLLSSLPPDPHSVSSQVGMMLGSSHDSEADSAERIHRRWLSAQLWARLTREPLVQGKRVREGQPCSFSAVGSQGAAALQSLSLHINKMGVTWEVPVTAAAGTQRLLQG